MIQEIGNKGHEQQNTNKFSFSCGKSNNTTIKINSHITAEAQMKGSPFFVLMLYRSLVLPSSFYISPSYQDFVNIMQALIYHTYISVNKYPTVGPANIARYMSVIHGWYST